MPMSFVMSLSLQNRSLTRIDIIEELKDAFYLALALCCC